MERRNKKQVLFLLVLALVGWSAACSSEEDVRKASEPSSQRWTKPYENDGYDQHPGFCILYVTPKTIHRQYTVAPFRPDPPLPPRMARRPA
jgi:hypothetical protein